MLPKIDVLVADECHQITNGSSTFDFVEQLNCPIKIGCSGTIPRSKYAKYSLIGLFSRIFYTEDIVKLQDEGFLTKVNITLLDITDTDVEADTNLLFNLNTTRKYSETNDIAFNEAFTEELNYITKNCGKIYAPVIEYVQSNFTGKNTLILFDRLEFGKNAFESAKETNAWGDSKIYYMDGSVDVSIREQIRAEFERTDGNVLYAQAAVMSTGINIKNLSVIVFMFQTKSASRVIQSIGRTLRLHKNKTAAEVVDVVFNFKYSEKHYKERMKLYREFYMKKKPDKTVRMSIGLAT
jgi:superfamily II DNA or RNA helicase